MKFLDDIAVMFGRAVRKPRHFTDEAEISHGRKRGKGLEVKQLIEELAGRPPSHKWRNRRWAVLISINLLFALSFWLDIQVLEGSLTASRLLGFHLADIYSSALVMLADRHVAVNLVIGSLTLLVFWGLLGGRAYCSWVCPYHLAAELAEMLHTKLVDRGIVRDHAFHRGARTVFWLLFALLAFVTQQTLFLTLNPIGILSRALIYGPSLALGWVLMLLLFEVVYSKRAWCRYVCPIGLTLGMVGAKAPVRIRYDLEACAHEGECRKVCEVPHVLDITIKGRAPDVQVAVGADCTRCGLCVDACPTRSLEFDVAGLGALLSIRLEAVSKAFGRARVLDGVNLELGHGERTALVGANGAGKTTLIRCLLGEYPCEGSVSIAGDSPRVERFAVLRRVGFVPQLPPPLKMPVDRLLRFAADVAGSDVAGMQATVERLGLDFAGLRRRPFSKLSGGQKQKILIAVALRSEADLLILDEPAANLDPEARATFFEMLAERDGRDAILISSHRLDEVASLVERVVELDGGRVVHDGRIASSGPLDAKLACRIVLREATEAASRALQAWSLRESGDGTVWEGDVAASDRLRFLGVVARYAGLVCELRLEERYD